MMALGLLRFELKSTRGPGEGHNDCTMSWADFSLRSWNLCAEGPSRPWGIASQGPSAVDHTDETLSPWHKLN